MPPWEGTPSGMARDRELILRSLFYIIVAYVFVLGGGAVFFSDAASCFVYYETILTVLLLSSQ